MATMALCFMVSDTFPEKLVIEPRLVSLVTASRTRPHSVPASPPASVAKPCGSVM